MRINVSLKKMMIRKKKLVRASRGRIKQQSYNSLPLAKDIKGSTLRD